MHYVYTAHTVERVNGSSASGQCSDVTTGLGFRGQMSRCNTPTSSVLLDSKIPNLTGLDGNMWASRLFTLRTTGSTNPFNIAFNFTNTPGYDGVGLVEVVAFNCPEIATSIQRINLFRALSDSSPNLRYAQFFPADTSCTSFVRFCITEATSFPRLTVEFFVNEDSQWVHLAELIFHGIGSSDTCTPGPVNGFPVTSLLPTPAASTVVIPTTTGTF